MNTYEESKKISYKGRLGQIPHQIKELQTQIKKLKEEMETILLTYPEFRNS